MGLINTIMGIAKRRQERHGVRTGGDSDTDAPQSVGGLQPPAVPSYLQAAAAPGFAGEAGSYPAQQAAQPAAAPMPMEDNPYSHAGASRGPWWQGMGRR